MDQLLTLGLKGLLGGIAVVCFALVGEVLRPRGLAGIFAASPSVALASLSATVLTTGAVAAHNQALGMAAGAVAMVVWCLLGTEAIKRFGALRGALASTVVWFVTAFSLWAVVLR